MFFYERRFFFCLFLKVREKKVHQKKIIFFEMLNLELDNGESKAHVRSFFYFI
jgi:hypothetical protein